LHGILNHVLSETIRRLSQSPAPEPEDPATWEMLAVDLKRHAADTVPNRLEAAGFLAKLAPEHQEVLRLRFYKDLSHDEIARHLGTTAGNARVRLWRVLNAAKAIAGAGPREDRP
jgi:DNA-directed RNA polymerase specialized sigma24 family protein